MHWSHLGLVSYSKPLFNSATTNKNEKSTLGMSLVTPRAVDPPSNPDVTHVPKLFLCMEKV